MDHGESLQWELKRPADGHDNPAWLSELRTMRGRVWHANGRRPHFRLSNGTFCDADTLDTSCYHILVRTTSGLIGSCRLLRLSSMHTCGMKEHLGSKQFRQLLMEVRIPPYDIGEASRWVVMPDYAGQFIGLRLVAGMWALARALGLRNVLAMAATREGQATVLIRSGARPIPSLQQVHSDHFDDVLVALSFDPTQAAKCIEPLIEEMAARLKL